MGLSPCVGRDVSARTRLSGFVLSCLSSRGKDGQNPRPVAQSISKDGVFQPAEGSCVGLSRLYRTRDPSLRLKAAPFGMTPRVDDRANFQTGRLLDFVETWNPEGV